MGRRFGGRNVRGLRLASSADREIGGLFWGRGKVVREI